MATSTQTLHISEQSNSCHPLCLDIDHFDDSGVAAAEVPFGPARLQQTARIVDVMLETGFGIHVSWFASGKKGLHGYGFGTVLRERHRHALAELLPCGAEFAFDQPQWSHAKVVATAAGAAKRLASLVNDLGDDDCGGWVRAIRAAASPDTSHQKRLAVLMPMFDVQRTKAGTLRAPMSVNSKNGAHYQSFPLRDPSAPGVEWPPSLKNRVPQTGWPSSTLAEWVDVMKCMNVNTEIDTAALDKACSSAKSGCASAPCGAQAVPRVMNKCLALPTDLFTRVALIPGDVRRKLGREQIAALELGISRGGLIPAKWKVEDYAGASSRAGCKQFIESCNQKNTLDQSIPLALQALTGLDPGHVARGSIVNALVVSEFPMECWAEAMVCAKAVRRDALDDYAGWLTTLLKPTTREVLTHSYVTGRLCPLPSLDPFARSDVQAALAVMRSGRCAGAKRVGRGEAGSTSSKRHKKSAVPDDAKPCNFPVDKARLKSWIDVLKRAKARLGGASDGDALTTAQQDTVDTMICEKNNDEERVNRIELEIRHLEEINAVLGETGVDQIQGMAWRSEGRHKAFYPGYGKSGGGSMTTLYGLAGVTRAIIASDAVICLDAEAAHFSAAWSALRNQFGDERASREFAAIKGVVFDKVATREHVALEMGRAGQLKLSKRLISMSLNHPELRTSSSTLSSIRDSRHAISAALAKVPVVAERMPDVDLKDIGSKNVLSRQLQCVEGHCIEQLALCAEANGACVVGFAADGLYVSASDRAAVDQSVAKAETALENTGIWMRFGVDSERPRI